MSSVLFVSPVDLAVGVASAQILNESGSITMSLGFTASTNGQQCTGARGYWAGPATTLKVSIWQGGTRLTSNTVVVTGAGVFTVTFSSPVALTAGSPYALSVWDTAGLNYTVVLISSGSILNLVLPCAATGQNVVAGQGILFCPYATPGNPYNQQGTGDTNPTTESAFYGSPLEPVMA